MGKLSNCLLITFKALALVLIVLFFGFISAYIYINSFKSSPSVNVTEPESRLNCFVCETRINYPNQSSSSINSSQGNLPEDTECLRNPKYIQLCQPGEYCVVLHQRLNEIERIVRTCHKGDGKLGCNSNIINGIEEKTCFCNKSYCCQIPFVGDGKQCFSV